MTEEDPSPCCSPAGESTRGPDGTGTTDAIGVGRKADAPDRTRMVELDPGTFLMGTDSDVGFPADGEGPVREVELSPFAIDRHAVTNAEFLSFVRDTDYTTEAEEWGWSFVFDDFVDGEATHRTLGQVEAAPWWTAVRGATWYRPEGPGSSIEDRMTHPVVHVSHRDANAYATWAGKRLPTEAEWEYAARGGLTQERFPWGDELTPDGQHRCNVWQGEFPDRNTCDDGYRGTAPVDAFDPNRHGLYNVAGNVWEWCSDWFGTDHGSGGDEPVRDPTGPSNGTERVMRGGSYLCHRSYCNRYRVAARSSNRPDSSTGNLGFRCAIDC